LYSGGPADQIVRLYNTGGNRFKRNAGGFVKKESPGEILGEISGLNPRVDEVLGPEGLSRGAGVNEKAS
jgi:hypothetical protein